MFWGAGTDHATSTNPLDERYANNKTSAAELDTYAARIIGQAINCQRIDKALVEKTKGLYDTGNDGEKSQAITLLSFIEDWFFRDSE